MFSKIDFLCQCQPQNDEHLMREPHSLSLILVQVQYRSENAVDYIIGKVFDLLVPSFKISKCRKNIRNIKNI